LENEITYGLSFEEEYDEDHIVEIGKAKVLREGKDVTIIAFSLVVKYALEAAEELAKEGIEAEVIDLRSIRPIDRETIVNSVKKTSRCITVEEGFPFASVGSEIASILIDEARTPLILSTSKSNNNKNKLFSDGICFALFGYMQKKIANKMASY
jgi:pyruvate dehydrogenase E1 component beta subunit